MAEACSTDVDTACMALRIASAAGRGPVDPAEGGYGNGVLKFPLDLSAVEDYFIPANGVYLDNVSPPPPGPAPRYMACPGVY